jgi:trk/ktr system potassium uptake protein
MYVVVAGGGHMGTHLVERLVAQGHETVVIDVDPRVTERIYSEQGVVVFTGSATDLGVLEQAGLKRAETAVAMTGRDSDNLSFCLLARHCGVPRVLARMLNPRYEVPYKLVGATKIHSEADILVDSFMTSIDFPEIGGLMQIGRGDIVAFDVPILAGSGVDGMTIADIVQRPGFPKRCVFIGVERENGEVEVPKGATTIRGGTRVIVAAHRPDLPQLLQHLAPKPVSEPPQA